MSSYTKSTDFASKDALLTGNPLKVVKGTEIDDEFNAIQTAVNSKADTNSPALAGTPTAPTAAVDTDSTQIATTAFVIDQISANNDAFLTTIETAYPVGSIYMNASNATNPSTLLGFGTWEALAAGKMLVGIDSGDTDFDTAGETGGAKEVTLTVGQLPAHSHDYAIAEYDGSYDYGTNMVVGNAAETTNGRNKNANTETIGSGDAIDIMNPYIVVYMWKRTA